MWLSIVIRRGIRLICVQRSAPKLLGLVVSGSMLPQKCSGGTCLVGQESREDASFSSELDLVAVELDCVLEWIVTAGGKLNDGVPCTDCGITGRA